MAAQQVTLNQLAPWLASYGDRLLRIDWPPIFKSACLILESSTKQNFALGQSPAGRPWKPLKNPRSRPRDKKNQRTEGRPGDNYQRPLRDSGLLMSSFSAGHIYHVEQITATEVVWGTSLEYAGVHQFGATISKPEQRRQKPWVFTGKDGRTVFTRRIKAHQFTIPARPFLGLNPQTVAEITALMAEAVHTQLQRGPAP